MNYHIGRLVLSSLCVGDLVRLVLSGARFAKRTPPNANRNKSSNTQRTENKTTDVLIHQHSRKLLKMDILMSETCWAHSSYSSLMPHALSARGGASSGYGEGDGLQIWRETEDTRIRSRGLPTSVAIELGYQARAKIQLAVKTYELTKCAKEPLLGQVLRNEGNLHVSESRITK